MYVYLLPARSSAANPAYVVALLIDRTDRRTDTLADINTSHVSGTGTAELINFHSKVSKIAVIFVIPHTETSNLTSKGHAH